MGRIYLIGLPGVGKTTLGQKIADFMNLPFVDIDCMLHEEAGRSRNGEHTQHVPRILSGFGR